MLRDLMETVKDEVTRRLEEQLKLAYVERDAQALEAAGGAVHGSAPAARLAGRPRARGVRARPPRGSVRRAYAWNRLSGGCAPPPTPSASRCARGRTRPRSVKPAAEPEGAPSEERHRLAVTFKEAIRQKLAVNLLIFALALVSGSFMISTLTFGEQYRIIVDLGLSAMEVFGTLIAAFLGAGLIAGDVERKTVFPIVAKPVSRAQYVAGRYAGLVTTTTLNLAVMAVFFVSVLAFYLGGLGFLRETPLLATLGALALQFAMVAAVAVLFSTFTTATLSAIFTLSLVVAGHLASDLVRYWEKQGAGRGSGRLSTPSCRTWRRSTSRKLWSTRTRSPARPSPLPATASSTRSRSVAHAAVFGGATFASALRSGARGVRASPTCKVFRSGKL